MFVETPRGPDSQLEQSHKSLFNFLKMNLQATQYWACSAQGEGTMRYIALQVANQIAQITAVF